MAVRFQLQPSGPVLGGNALAEAAIMALVDKHELEERAAQLVVDELGAGSYEALDIPGAPDNSRDFEILFTDGHREPLEVTTNLDTTVMKSLGRTGGGIIELDADVARLWMVTSEATWTDTRGETQPFDRDKVVALIVPLIEQLERDGETSLDMPRLAWPLAYGGTYRYAAAARELHARGISHGSSIDRTHPDVKAGISIHLGGGGAVGPATLTTALEEIAAREDNVAKLASRADADRRHLFVALSGRGSNDMASWALQSYLDGWVWDQDPPLPALPDAITTIWAGNRHGGIYASPPDKWRRFGSTRG